MPSTQPVLKSINASAKEHPILFSGEMVRAILEGRKTQTRRVVTFLPEYRNAQYVRVKLDARINKNDPVLSITHSDAYAACPYGRRGDRLWVRETFCFPVYAAGQPTTITYRADEVEPRPKNSPAWRPSIFMPRKFSRLTLQITDVRVERLQEIAEQDCVAEGVQVPATTKDCPAGKARILTQLTGPGPHGSFAPCAYLPRGDESLAAYSRAHFASGWDALNAKRGYSWESNPWVWAISFRRTD